MASRVAISKSRPSGFNIGETIMARTMEINRGIFFWQFVGVLIAHFPTPQINPIPFA
jgi:hypothetical protein